jgi:hypothetical protein
MADVAPTATIPESTGSGLAAYNWKMILGTIAVAYLLRELLTRGKSSNPKRRRRSK